MYPHFGISHHKQQPRNGNDAIPRGCVALKAMFHPI